VDNLLSHVKERSLHYVTDLRWLVEQRDTDTFFPTVHRRREG